MSTITLERTVGELVTERPSRARVFEKFGLDYCCGGHLPLGQACAKKGIDARMVVGIIELLDEQTGRSEERDWSRATLGELCDHIEQIHHGYLRRALAAGARGFLAKDAPVEQLAGAIRRIHEGGRHIDTDLAAAAMVGGESPLTDRETEVLRAAADGTGVAKIASLLHLSEGTVRNYLSNAIGKIGADNRMAAIRTAQDMGWL